MAQNIYDTPEFFEGYSKLERSVHGLAGAPEWPRLRALLPPSLTGLNILDLGCGFGWFARWAQQEGAASVYGIDVSENMLARAKALASTETPGEGQITYLKADLDSWDPPPNAKYDLVFSSLALHYLADLPRLVSVVHRVLRPGGTFVFSIEHPIFLAPSAPGMATDPETGKRYWRLDDYQVETQRTSNWLAEGVRKQHRTLTTWINSFLDSGFQLTGFEEWKPTAEHLEKNPGWIDELARPMFLLMRVTRN